VFTALDKMGPFLDRQKFTVVRVDAAAFHQRCMSKTVPEVGLLVNSSSEDQEPLAVLNLSQPVPNAVAKRMPTHFVPADGRRPRAASDQTGEEPPAESKS